MTKKIPNLSGVMTANVNAAKQAAGATSSDPLYRVGSSGSGVENLQKALLAAGYDVGNAGADGVYGNATAAAVKQYQKDHGLAVDGIAGKNTLGSLYQTANSTGTKALRNAATTIVNNAKNVVSNPASAGLKTLSTLASDAVKGAKVAAGATKSTPAAAAETATAKETTPTTPAETTTTTETQPTQSADSGFTYDDFVYDDFTYQDYAPSDVVNQANALLQQQYNSKPGEYQSQWQDEISDYLNQIQNRDPFSYDFNSDALYQQYKDMYTQQGRMAMMDTMGQAAAMTGGYGNSYAQTVGQQAYNQQLSQLNDIMPELYQMAFDRYAYEGQQLQDMYDMYMGLENQDYGRYQDEYSNWYTQLQYLTNQYNTERELDYNRYQDGRQEALNQYNTNKDIAYNEYTADKDVAWNEYLAEKEKEEAAANLMAGIGNYDRLQGVYGLTDEELAAYKKAMTPASGGGSYTYSNPKPKDEDEDEDVMTETEKKMDAYVSNMLNNATSSQFNPQKVINGNSNLTAEEKKVANEILNEYINQGYMKI